ncbi:MAG: SDR family NAD(P)-dependent oxidoreductase, partial [Hyphomicrobiaceae bacterium]
MDLNKRFGLAGKSALVTGASSGLGRHFAEVLAGAGAQVALAARRMDLLNHAAEEIRGVGGKAVALELDVSQGAAVAQAFDVAEAEIGAIDIVINNAGVASESWFVETSEEEWRRTMDVNLDGVYRVGREAAQRMKAAGSGGSIINVASVLGLRVMPGLSSYAVSKAAVVQLTKSMALELARDNIRVNAIAPG